jgi:hypothetical protein
MTASTITRPDPARAIRERTVTRYTPHNIDAAKELRSSFHQLRQLGDIGRNAYSAGSDVTRAEAKARTGGRVDLDDSRRSNAAQLRRSEFARRDQMPCVQVSDIGSLDPQYSRALAQSRSSSRTCDRSSDNCDRSSDNNVFPITYRRCAGIPNQLWQLGEVRRHAPRVFLASWPQSAGRVLPQNRNNASAWPVAAFTLKHTSLCSSIVQGGRKRRATGIT